MCYVVGSGFAGIACAKALLAAGKRVTILDAGLQLEEERRAAAARLAAADPAEWTEASTAFLRERAAEGESGIPLKLAYGSDFPYRDAPGALRLAYEGSFTKACYARGGLSTVWGGAVMPYRQEDIYDWPISIADLEPGYRAVLDWLPLSAREDALSRFFPLYADRFTFLPMSRQGSALLTRLEARRRNLNAHGVHFGSSRLTVNTHDSQGRPLCVRCGFCLQGCPHDLIYTTGQTLSELLAAGRLHYEPGIMVQRVEETGSGVLIRGVDARLNPVSFNADRVYLGAGILNTTAILLRSLGRFDTPVPIRESPYFLLPMLSVRGTPGVFHESLHTLAQLFIEVFDKKISPYTIHFQTYTYSQLFRDQVASRLGSMAKAFPLEKFMGRLVLFLCHFHSHHSASISASLSCSGGGDTLHLRAEPNPATRRAVGAVVGKFARLGRDTGLIPLAPLLQFGKPLRSFHYGGSFPLSASPGPLETDTLGRPAGMRRVHAIDTSVLPSIASTTVTLTVMANAWRIGSLSIAESD